MRRELPASDVELRALRERAARLSDPQRRVLIERLEARGLDPWAWLPLPRASGDGTRCAPLSFAQERLRIAHELDSTGARLNLFGAYRLRGALSIGALERALAELMRRHEILRTSLVWEEGAAVQRVESPGSLPTPLGVISAGEAGVPVAAAQAGTAELCAWALAEARRPFELVRAPLWRARLLSAAECEHVLVLALHHCVADAWSLGTFVEELAAAYRAALQGVAPATAPPPVQYADFARWQRERWSGARAETQLDYWRTQLRDLEPAPALLYWRGPGEVRAAEDAMPGRVLRDALDPALSQRLRREARARGMTPFMLLVAAFQLLLHRASGRGDVAVGTSLADRPHPDLEGSIGFFVNLLVLRADLRGNPRGEVLLEQSRKAVLGALAHRDAPFERVFEALRPGAQFSDAPLFRALFVLQRRGAEPFALPGLEVERIELGQRFARYELSLRVGERANGPFALALEYDRERIGAQCAQVLLAAYPRLLRGLLESAERRVSELPFAEPAPARAAQAPAPLCAASGSPARTLHAAFDAWAERAPERDAIVTPAGTWTYAELASASQAIGGALREAGVQPGRPVSIALEPGPQFAAAALAVLRCGAAFLPIDPDWPQARRDALLRASGARCRIEPVEDASERDAARVRVVPGPRVAPAGAADPELAYVMATSGSSGEPKCVGVTHASALAYAAALAERVPLAERARLLWLTAISADLGYTSFFGALLCGRTLVTADRETALTADRLEAFLRATPVDLLKIAPSQLLGLLLAADDPAALLPRSALVLGGESPAPALLRRVAELAPVCRVFNHYGPTEATIGVIMDEIEGVAQGRPAPLGRAFPHVRARVLDRTGQPLPEGFAGELALGGACLARGYLGAPALTASAFVPDPESGRGGVPAGARLYRTGDRVEQRDGRFEFCGRIDAQLNLRGLRIEPAEVERALRALPGVAQARVTLAQGETGVRLIAYLCAEPGASLDPERLRAQLAQRLPRPWIPADYARVERWPLLASGKLGLAELAARARPLGGAGARARAPGGETEARLARIWCEVLRRESVAADEDFFELGGDSILALQIVARARRAGLALAPRQLFESPTIAALAAALDASDDEPAVSGPVPPRPPERELPLTPIQQWFFEQPLRSPDHFNQALILPVPPGLDRKALGAALERLVELHPVLAQRFIRDGERWRSLPAAESAAAALECFDLDPDRARARAQIEAICAERQTQLSLERGELLRALHFERAPGRAGGGRLALIAHHLAVDAVSWRIALDDLSALLRGDSPPAPPSDHGDWAASVARYAQSAEAQSELAHWSAVPPSAPLPRDAQGPNLYGSLAAVERSLDEPTTAALLRWAAGQRLRVDALLLAALAPALCAWCRLPGVVVDAESHGRADLGEGLDLSRALGWFTARFPLLLRAEGSLAARARALTRELEALPHLGVGYGALRYLSPHGEALRARPGPELGFNYLGQLDRGAAGQLYTQRDSDEVAESLGPQRDPQSPRSHLLQVNAQVSGGRLRLAWLYGARVHRHATVKGLADGAERELIALAERWA